MRPKMREDHRQESKHCSHACVCRFAVARWRFPCRSAAVSRMTDLKERTISQVPGGPTCDDELREPRGCAAFQTSFSRRMMARAPSDFDFRFFLDRPSGWVTACIYTFIALGVLESFGGVNQFVY
jgi:hypothetical protein